jgi:ribosomal protein S18 acetylase RimI-like enzyme
MQSAMSEVFVREATVDDLAAISAIDSANTGLAKPDYWQELFDGAGANARSFLIAEAGGPVIGFVVGEVRAWEFGSPAAGWVFAIQVAEGSREGGIGRALLAALCERFAAAGVAVVRTMVSRRDIVNLSFFRGEGLTAGPYVELEKRLEA